MLRQFTRFRRDGRADKQSAIRRMQDFGYDVIMRRKALRFRPLLRRHDGHIAGRWTLKQLRRRQ